ncbi:MAG: tetratricopeptide repeat protein [Deltaproteobacteria bacterium]|nr:tetratricopeptide repeat protein [Deltaproteobacteria bacterium]
MNILLNYPRALFLNSTILWVIASSCASSSLSPATSSKNTQFIGDLSTSKSDFAVLNRVVRGLYLITIGKHTDAVKELQLALEIDSNSPTIYKYLFTALNYSGNYNQAKYILAEGLQKYPASPILNFIAGEQALSQSNYVVAQQALTKALADDDLIERATPPLVETLLSMQQFTTALQKAKILIKRLPANATLTNDLAAIFEDYGHLDAAIAMYQHARVQRPSYIEAVLGEVRLRNLQGDFAAAAQALIPLFQYYPDQLEYYLELIYLLRKANDTASETYHDAVLRIAKGDLISHLRIVAFDIGSQKTQTATTILREAVHDWPTNVEPRLMLATIALKNNDAASCIKLLNEINSPNLKVYHLRGECFAALGNFAAMLNEFATALPMSNIDEELISDLNIIMRYAPNIAKANLWRQKLLRLFGAKISSLNSLLVDALLFDYFNYPVEAFAFIARHIAKAKPDRKTLLLYAHMASRDNKNALAISVLEKMLQQNPQDPALLNALGFIMTDANINLRRAEIMLRRAYRLASSHSYIVDSLGWLLYRQGKNKAAVRILEDAAVYDPNDPEILFHLGEVYLSLGRSNDAKQCFIKALKMRPAINIRKKLQDKL